MTGFRNLMTGAAGASTGGFSVNNSAVFDDGTDQFFSRTPSSAGNLRKWTFSCWIKLGSVAAADRRILSAGASDGASTNIRINSSHQLEIFRLVGGSFAGRLTTNRLFRDPHAWYNIVASVDTEEDTAGNRFRLYVNGEEETSFATESQPDEDSDLHVNSTNSHKIGEAIGGGENFDGYIAQAVLIDGSQLAASSFGEYDENGVWRPVSVSGLTFGTNGFYLNMASSGADLGDDASGNSNDFTNNNSATQSGDSPTTNHCVWSPLTMDLNASSSLALSKGNLVVSNTASEDTNVHGSFGLSAGKWYFEVTVDTINEIFLGVSDATIASNANAKTEAGAFVLDLKNANKYNNDGGSSYGSAFTNGDVANVALDLDNGKIWIGKDGTYPNSGNPATGSNEMYSGISGTFFPFLSTQGGGTKQGTTNFGQSSFTTSAPSGFEPWNTAKLYEDAAPAIEDGSAHFQATTYTGNGADGLEVNQSGNSTFKPSLAWFKNRAVGDSHALYDLVRGIDKRAYSNTNTDGGTTSHIASFDADGFTVNNDTQINGSGNAHVTWQWKGDGTSGSTNSNGSINSTVNVNTTSGFVAGTYTTPSEAAAVRTIGHGLGGALDMLFLRNQGTGHWAVWHNALGNEYLRLNATDAKTSGGTETNSLWNATLPSASTTTFSIGTNSDVNGNNVSFMFYGFRAIPGYSAFGSYSGNGSSNGPLISLDFTPSFFLQKRIDSSGAWHMYDTARDPFNYNDTRLFADSASAEYSNGEGILDILSNGVKIRDTETWFNASGGTFMYMAFAENPFSGTTPATAR